MARPSPRCLGKKAWPCDHHEKHVLAGRLGWRRHHGTPRPAEEVRKFSALFGTVTRAHTDESHPGRVVFRDVRKKMWFDLPMRDWQAMVREGAIAQREARQEARAQASQEADYRKGARAERAKVTRAIRALGKIRPYAKNQKGKHPEIEEWRELPPELRSRTGRVTPDEAAQAIGERYPDTRIHSDSDLIAYLRRRR